MSGLHVLDPWLLELAYQKVKSVQMQIWTIVLLIHQYYRLIISTFNYLDFIFILYFFLGDAFIVKKYGYIFLGPLPTYGGGGDCSTGTTKSILTIVGWSSSNPMWQPWNISPPSPGRTRIGGYRTNSLGHRDLKKYGYHWMKYTWSTFILSSSPYVNCLSHFPTIVVFLIRNYYKPRRKWGLSSSFNFLLLNYSCIIFCMSAK